MLCDKTQKVSLIRPRNTDSKYRASIGVRTNAKLTENITQMTYSYILQICFTFSLMFSGSDTNYMSRDMTKPTK